MKSVWKKLIATISVCGLVVGLAVAPRLAAQEKKVEGKPAAEKKDGEKKEGEKKERAEPKGRLPNHYGEVISGDQRDKIYAIQAKYKDELEKLQAQLKALDAKIDAEIEAVLTPEQKEKVAKIAAEAKAKAKAAAEARAKEIPLPGNPTPVKAPALPEKPKAP